MQWRIGPFRLDVDHVSLWRGDQRVALRPKPFELLVYLVEHAGELVTKDELLTVIWPEAAVAENALTVAMSELRKVLGETARAPQYIATVHRRGYRFIARVEAEAAGRVVPSSVAAVAQEPLTRRLAAILSADVQGYSRLLERDDEATVQTLSAHRQVMAALIEQHGVEWSMRRAIICSPSSLAWWTRRKAPWPCRKNFGGATRHCRRSVRCGFAWASISATYSWRGIGSTAMASPLRRAWKA